MTIAFFLCIKLSLLGQLSDLAFTARFSETWRMATLRERLQAQITAKEASLELARAAYNRLLENDILEYNFGAADSHQRARRVDVEKIKRQVDALESELESLYRRYSGYGLTMINLRRKV